MYEIGETNIMNKPHKKIEHIILLTSFGKLGSHPSRINNRKALFCNNAFGFGFIAARIRQVLCYKIETHKRKEKERKLMCVRT